MTVRFNIKGNSQKVHVAIIFSPNCIHFQFLLLNVSPKSRILIFKQTKKEMTPAPSAFAIYVNYGDQSFVHA